MLIFLLYKKLLLINEMLYYYFRISQPTTFRIVGDKSNIFGAATFTDASYLLASNVSSSVSSPILLADSCYCWIKVEISAR